MGYVAQLLPDENQFRVLVAALNHYLKDIGEFTEDAYAAQEILLKLLQDRRHHNYR